jgi:predicted transcriptional regulator
MQSDQLASLITFHRKEADLSPSELATHAEVSRYVVQDLEAGTGRTTWGKLQAVLGVLNLQLEPEGPLVKAWRQSLNTNDHE